MLLAWSNVHAIEKITYCMRGRKLGREVEQNKHRLELIAQAGYLVNV